MTAADLIATLVLVITVLVLLHTLPPDVRNDLVRAFTDWIGRR